MLPGDETAVISDGLNAAFLPARGPDCASSPKGPPVRVPGHVADPRLATSAVALDGTADGNARPSPSYAPQQSWTAARTMNPCWKLLLVEVNVPPDPERWARQRDLVLRPPAPSYQEARPTANL
jgi:hypothetical protein